MMKRHSPLALPIMLMAWWVLGMDVMGAENPGKTAQTRHSPTADAALPPAMDTLAGDWEIFDADGKRVGRSRILAQRQGAMLYEERSVGDGPPQQLWLYNAETHGGWSQLFVAPDGRIREFPAQSPPDAQPMLMGAEVRLADGAQVRFRLSMRLSSPDEHLRRLEISRDAGTSWKPVFDYRYRREKGPESLPDR